MSSTLPDSDQVLTFWFETLKPAQWWKKDAALDREIAERFGELLHQSRQSILDSWRNTARGRLAEIIVLDQFSRQVYRDSAEAFSADPLALSLAQQAVRQGADSELTVSERVFLYMPYMHSESRQVHETAVELFTRLGEANNLDYELRHKAIIDRFGRYPHRNAVLGRQSTEEEIAFLSQPGSSF